VKKSQLKVLQRIYQGTDCCNDVYDYAMLHYSQERIADAMPDLVCHMDGVQNVDGDGFAVGGEGRGYRLTKAGYEALTASDPERYPESQRRFA
jgi:hypothetical protein